MTDPIDPGLLRRVKEWQAAREAKAKQSKPVRKEQPALPKFKPLAELEAKTR